MKILNLYAGIGGNRKLWTPEGDEHEITAVEYEPSIAKIYQDFFPNDKVLVEDAHQYLLEHFAEYDFIWSSPPCPTHTKMNIANSISPYKDNTKQLQRGGGIIPRYADMALYQEIILLKHHFKGQWCVENVIAYYEPLIKPFEIAKHYFWTNFYLPPFKGNGRGMGLKDTTKDMAKLKGFDWEKLKGLDRELVLRNCVEPETGKYILDRAIKQEYQTLL